ncbi:IclR family transcriptional regulator [Lapillicoccus jejuensis]|uniref:IclR family transcriptional regulator n=1 Tax=Lapillicoccus jejuensis TaxID=402171 RepID=A0A542E4E6_9MICO|nr:helix-turn-helix domain-containing protein [Lapillicoccus jejuensis]TQJ10201.1 IclR family transcriptional regulator [Lapillicoccus jejuensis]
MRKHHRTVDRVAALLDAVAGDGSGLSLTELAGRLDAPVSSVQKLVDGLVATGYLDERDRRYVLGPAPWVLATRAGSAPVPAIPHEALQHLSAATGLPVLLAARVGDTAVYVDWAGTDEAFDVALSARVRTSLAATAAGRVLLAWRPADERRRVALGAGGDPAASARLTGALERIRRDGHEHGDSGPLLPGAVAVAVPLRRGAEVTGALAVAARTVRRRRLPASVVDTLEHVARTWST